MHSTHLLVPIPGQEATPTINHKCKDRQDPKCPRQPQLADHGVGGKRVGQTAEARPCGADAIGERATLGEPLWEEAHAACEEEAHACAKGDALREDEMPNLAGERRTYEGGSAVWLLAEILQNRQWTKAGWREQRDSLRLENHTNLKTCACAKVADDDGG